MSSPQRLEFKTLLFIKSMDFNFEVFLNQLSRELNKLKSSIFVGYFDEDDDGLFRVLRAFHGGGGGGEVGSSGWGVFSLSLKVVSRFWCSLFQSTTTTTIFINYCSWYMRKNNKEVKFEI